MRKNKIIPSLLITIAISIFIIVLLILHIFQPLHLKFSDKFHGNEKINENIIIIGIDSKSLNEETGLGNLSNWSVNALSKILTQIDKAKVIGFDLLISNPNQNITQNELIEMLKSSEDKLDFFDRIEPYAFSPTPDQKNFAEKIKNLPIVLAKYSVLEKTLNFNNGFIDETNTISREPIEIYQKSTNLIGQIGNKADTDDVIRSIYIGSTKNNQKYEEFPLLISKLFLNLNNEEGIYNQNEKTYKLSEASSIKIPLDGNNKFKIRFFGEPYNYKYYSFVDVLNGEIPKENFENKIVLIGPTAATLQDTRFVPTSHGVPMPGVEIHANAIQTIIDQDFLRDQSKIAQMLTIFGVTLASCFAFIYLGILPSVIYLIAACVLYTVAAKISFDKGIIINIVYPYLAIILSFVSIYLYRYFTEIKSKKQLQSAFSKYVNPEVVREISENPELIKLGGEEKEITVFFSDIVNSTHIAENLSPENLVTLLNEYFEVMTSIIMNNKGTLDKYEGDAIMAFWNAPVDVKEHAYFACLSAIQGRQALAALHEKWTKEGKPLIDYRVGLNSGLAIIGNVGSKDRFNYTAMGDNINLGSRLEAINKQYGTHACVSEFTYEKVKDQFEFRQLDKIKVKGKDIPITIYELIGLKNSLSETAISLVRKFEEGLNLYQQKDFVNAKACFTNCLQIYSEDKPSQVFIDRCEHFISNPPDSTFNGVWVYETK